MATLTSSLIVRLIDQVTGPAKKIGGALLGLNNAAKGNFGANLNAAIERNNQSLAAARGNLFDAAAAFYALKTAIGSPIRAASQFESSMSDVRKVVDRFQESPEAFAAFKAELIALSKQVPLSVNGLSQIAAAAGQAGIASEDIIAFTNAAAKVGVAFDISAGQAGDAMTTMRAGLGLTVDETVLLMDSMNHLSNAQASSAANILDVVRRTGAQSKLYGFTAEQTAAFASAMTSAGAESEVAATSFRNLGLNLTRGASATKRQNKAFKTLGMSSKKVAKAMQKDAVGTTLKVLEAISKLPAEMQGAVSSDLFGNEARALGPLLTNIDLLRESLKLIADPAKYAGSAFKEFEIRAKTFQNATEIFSNRMTALKIVIGAALIPAINDLMAAISPLIDKFAAWAAENPALISGIAQAAAALVALKIASAGLTFIGLLGKGGALSMMALGFNTLGKAAIASRAAIAGTIALQTALAGGASYGGLAKMADAAGALVRITPGLNLVAPALSAIGGALAAISLPVVAGIAVVAGAGLLIYKYWDRISSIFAGVGKALGEHLAPALDAIRPALDFFAPLGEKIAAGWEKASSALSSFGQWLGDIFSPETLSAGQQAGFEQLGYDITNKLIAAVKAKFAELVAWLGTIGAQIGASVSGGAGSLFDAGVALMTSLFEGLKSVGSSILSWASGLAGRIGASIRGAVSSITGIGGGAEDAGGTKPVTGHRARGGNVWPGGSFLVGDGGEEEIFTPKTAGRITPVSDLADSAPASGATAPAGQAAAAAPAKPAEPANVRQTIRFGAIGPFHITGGGDPVETARAVAREVETKLTDLMRGAHADMGARA